MVLGYQGGDRLKVPVEAFDRIQKYTAAEGARPPLDRLGSGKWENVKRRVKQGHARHGRGAAASSTPSARRGPGTRLPQRAPGCASSRRAFDFEETPDQAQAIADVAKDMAASTPMDRLVCGDVGYGKTEVAMRAAMRAVLDGKQVAVLAPTTVLAFQHWKTFRSRFAPFPVAVEHGVAVPLAEGDQEGSRRDAATGRSTSSSAPIASSPRTSCSSDLGLLDRRRRATLRRRRKGEAEADPEERRLPHALGHAHPAHPADGALRPAGHVGHRDPAQGSPGDPDVDREVLGPRVLAAAIRQELGRGGQVFFVHNRVEIIDSLAAQGREARSRGAGSPWPTARCPRRSSSRRMSSFVDGRSDVLVATTIVENGLDIPRANTILINRADRFGLAQLYQLRGRVGRSDRRAYAYLLVPETGAALGDRAKAARRHPGVLRPGRRFPHRGTRPGAARRRQSSRRRAERPDRGRGPRSLRQAPRAAGPRAPGRRQGEPCPGPC